MDVKPANFMTDKGMSRLKVGDLGFAGREFFRAIVFGKIRLRVLSCVVTEIDTRKQRNE